jgi:hypothetical protein
LADKLDPRIYILSRPLPTHLLTGITSSTSMVQIPNGKTFQALRLSAMFHPEHFLENLSAK